jgi:repressor of nif and glnA expression
MFILDKNMQILRVIANSSSQIISQEQIALEAKKTSNMEEEQVEESLKILELNGLVGRRGDLYYTTTRGSIIARKGMSL